MAGQVTLAVPVARLTVALTPPSLLSFLSTLAAHEAQVIPPIASSTARTAPPGAAAGPAPVTVLIRASPLSLPGHVRPGPFGKTSRPERTGHHARPAVCSASGELVIASLVEGIRMTPTARTFVRAACGGSRRPKAGVSPGRAGWSAGAPFLVRDAGQDLIGVGAAAGPGDLLALVADGRTAHGGSPLLPGLMDWY